MFVIQHEIEIGEEVINTIARTVSCQNNTTVFHSITIDSEKPHVTVAFMSEHRTRLPPSQLQDSSRNPAPSFVVVPQFRSVYLGLLRLKTRFRPRLNKQPRRILVLTSNMQVSEAGTTLE